jgi:hypothetical protein
MRRGLPTKFSPRDREPTERERESARRARELAKRPRSEAPTLLMTHVGAHGYCDSCGHDFELTQKDRPIEYRSKRRYEIPCPKCGKTVSCDAQFIAEEAVKVRRPRTSDRGSPAPFVPKHMPSHVGASGYCGRCGSTFVLGDRDKPHKIIVDGNESLGRVVFLVKCPICKVMDDAQAEVFLRSKK